jgi:hypothetical protein
MTWTCARSCKCGGDLMTTPVIVQGRSPRLIDTEELRWSDDSGTLRQWSFHDIH